MVENARLTWLRYSESVQWEQRAKQLSSQWILLNEVSLLADDGIFNGTYT